jgi:hypothetical protein
VCVCVCLCLSVCLLVCAFYESEDSLDLHSHDATMYPISLADGPLPLHVSQMDADPRDLNAQGGSDVRTLDKLVDGVHLTTQDNHMWMVPFTADGVY